MHAIELWEISRLIEYARNPRKNDHAVDRIAAAIHEFGFRVPILAKSDGSLIDGHLRLKAARKLNLEKVPVIIADDMTDVQIKAFRISVNKMADLAEWDDELLALEFDELADLGFDTELTGFSQDEIDGLIPQQVKEGLTDEDETPEPPVEPVTVLGDVWLLGNHRLMCGDSTSIDSIKKLMNGSVCDLGFCDPPYNLGYEYNSYDDNKTDKEYEDFSHSWFDNLVLFTEKQIVTLGTKNIKVMANLADKVAGVGCWVKKNWITSCHIAKLQQWEPIFFYGDFTKFKRSSDLFEINREYQSDVGGNHTCPKQIKLIDEILIHYCNKKVLDMFGGSGTTLISSEKNNKAAFLMELDPKYCDVIIKRWQDFTGKEAIHEQSGQTFNSMKPS